MKEDPLVFSINSGGHNLKERLPSMKILIFLLAVVSLSKKIQ